MMKITGPCDCLGKHLNFFVPPLGAINQIELANWSLSDHNVISFESIFNNIALLEMAAGKRRK